MLDISTHGRRAEGKNYPDTFPNVECLLLLPFAGLGIHTSYFRGSINEYARVGKCTLWAEKSDHGFTQLGVSIWTEPKQRGLQFHFEDSIMAKKSPYRVGGSKDDSCIRPFPPLSQQQEMFDKGCSMLDANSLCIISLFGCVKLVQAPRASRIRDSRNLLHRKLQTYYM